MANIPKVTGISPKDGLPRTKLTIRGENLGCDENDLVSVKICEIECMIFTEWISPQKIITRSPHTKAVGEVIVTTRRGGVGISMIQFRAYEEPIGLTTPSGVWVDECDPYQSADYRAPQSPSIVLSDSDGGSSPFNSRSSFDKPLSSMFAELGPSNAYTDILSESFSPSVYLIENYRNASFGELKQFYRSQLEKCNSESKNTLNSNAFLKANVLSIIDCLNALNVFYQTFKKDKQEVGAELTGKIEECIKVASSEAHDIFDNIISRKDKSDSTRNALNVLQRYRFLFNLPSNIDKSMQKKDYDVVINDFFRAKNLFSQSSVNVFRRVYLEVEKRIEKFSFILRETFERYCVTVEEKNIDELKKLIKYLSALEIGTDPAWETIQLMKGTLFDKIGACRKAYLDSTTTTSFSSSNSSSSKQKATMDNSSSSDHITEPPAEVKFVDEISKMFSIVFNDLFKLGSAYLNGDLYTKDINVKLKAEIFEKEVVNESINRLCTELRAVLLPAAGVANYVQPVTMGSSSATANIRNKNGADTNEQQRLVIWLPYCLRCSVNCYSSLIGLDYGAIHMQNTNILKQLQQFIFDLRLHTMTCLFAQASIEIRNLAAKETWNIQFDDIYGVRTNLPVLFETKVIETLQLIRDSVLQIRNTDEVDIFSQINVKGAVKQLAQNIINSFLIALEKSVTNIGGSGGAANNITEDNRSLIVLCNCSYTNNFVLQKLYEAFDKYGYPDMSQVIQLTQKKFKELEIRLLDLFIERKRDSVIGIIEPSMYLFDANWTSAKEMPKDVSYYVKETVQSLIFVQAEIYQITPQLVNSTMFVILMATIEEIERLFESCINKISDAARVQMLIDITAIDYVLRNTGSKYYPKLKRKIDACRAICIGGASVQDSTIRKVIDDVTIRFCDSMRLQISCFNFDYENMNNA